jgi:hypothetical protein
LYSFSFLPWVDQMGASGGVEQTIVCSHEIDEVYDDIAWKIFILETGI